MSKLEASTLRGLYATPVAPVPFLKGVVVRSFLLEREAGNVIIYNAPGLTTSADDILGRATPERMLVNHRHESIYPAPSFDVPIYVHEADMAQTRLPITGTFSKREKFAPDLELIPTPGHTAGTTAFIWDNGNHRLLFPGDSIWVQGGQWKAVLLGESSRKDYIASLSLLKDVDFDVLVPWGGDDGQQCAYLVTRGEAQANLDKIISRLKAGDNV